MCRSRAATRVAGRTPRRWQGPSTRAGATPGIGSRSHVWCAPCAGAGATSRSTSIRSAGPPSPSSCRRSRPTRAGAAAPRQPPRQRAAREHRAARDSYRVWETKMSDRVSVRLEGGIADVRLARPDKLNALDPEMFQALVATGERLGADRSLRAVVLSGEGRAFSAGLDVASFMGGGAVDLLARSPASLANFAQRAAWVWTEIPVPVVAAVHGVAFGGGLQIALAADVRFVSPDARLSVMEIKWGLVPDMSGTQTLRRLVRLDVAKELTYTGRVVGGAEAVELGLATHLADSPREEIGRASCRERGSTAWVA